MINDSRGHENKQSKRKENSKATNVCYFGYTGRGHLT